MKYQLLILVIFFFSICLMGQLHYQDSAPVGMGARAMGMGGAFISIADDATAITWNPAGLGQMESIEISLVGSTRSIEILRSASFSYGLSRNVYVETFQNAYYDRGSSTSFDFIGLTIPVRVIPDSNFKIVFQYCYQVLANFNMLVEQTPKITYKSWIKNDTEWWSDSEYSRTFDASGGRYAHSIGAGFQIGSSIYLGLSTNIIVGNTDIHVTIDSNDFSHNSEGDSFRNHQVIDYVQSEEYTAMSINAGLLFSLPANIKIGFVYKSGYELEGTLKQDISPDVVHTGILNYPATYGGGVSYRPIDNLTLAFDFNYTEFSKCWGTNTSMDYSTYYPSSNLKYDPDGADERLKQHDSTQLRIGAEYVFVLEDFFIALRGGIFWDKRYYMDYTGEIPIHLGLTSGIGIVWHSFVLDLAVAFTMGDEMDSSSVTGPSSFSSTTFLGSIIYRF